MEKTHISEAFDGDDLEALGCAEGQDRVTALVAQELGGEMAANFEQVWSARDRRADEMHPNEGLRERKKRLTRQRLSDAATLMFITRGFNNVRIAEIAEVVGVSEKTVYNYFPTKESLVFDESDSQQIAFANAVRNRPKGSSPMAAFVAALKQDTRRFSESLGDTWVQFLNQFGQMIRETPSLQAAWGEHRHQMVQRITEALAEGFGVDPRDPEMLVAARSLTGLVELYYDSLLRHLDAGVEDSDELRQAIDADLDRGARLIETGMWSLHVLVEGRRTKAQVRDLAVAAEQARQQVMATLREAKATFGELQAAAREAHEAHHADVRAANADVRAANADARRAQRDAQRAIQAEIRAAIREARAGGRKR